MSKASTASAKTLMQLPSQSPWAKGPPPNSNSSAPSPRSQPAIPHIPSPITIPHTRRPSTLGQGVPIKEGVTVPRNNVGSIRQDSAAVTFGSIDETSRHHPCSPNIGAVAEDMSPRLSALVTAKKIERLQDIEYAEGIRGPREDLNKDAKDGKFRYDRDFLMQFMQLCKEKPPNLPPLDILGMEPMDQSPFSMTRGGLGFHRLPANAMPPTPRQSLVSLRVSGSSKPGGVPGPFQMGSFSTPTSKLTSKEPYIISMTGTPSASDDLGGHPEESKRKREEQARLRQEKDTKEWAKKEEGKGREQEVFPLDIYAEREISAVSVSTLAIARNIERLQDIEYPEGVRSPREDLNKDAKDGRFRYDRDFLMQFMQLCKEKPPNLPPLDVLGIEPVDRSSFVMARGSSGRHRQPAHHGSTGLGISGNLGVKPGTTTGPFAMGQFSTPTSGPSKRTRSKRGKIAFSQQVEGQGRGAPGALGTAPILEAALEPVELL